MVLNLNGDTKWVNQLVTLEQKQRWDIEFARRQAKAEGIAEGEARGRTEGETRGEERMASLFARLNSVDRSEDFARAATDEEYRQKLYKEFGI